MKCKHDQGKINVDVYEETRCGIYSKASMWLNEINDHWISKTDIEQVDLKFMKCAEPVSTYRLL